MIALSNLHISHLINFFCYANFLLFPLPIPVLWIIDDKLYRGDYDNIVFH